MALCTMRSSSFSPLAALLLLLVLESAVVPRERMLVEGQSTAELDLCATNLIAADVNLTDGYLSLYEYEDFVNERYYRNCPARVVVAESVAQWQAFTSLACLSCLEETLANSLTSGGTLSALPDCCLPFNNSRIEIQSIQNSRDTGGTSAMTVGSSDENASMAWLQRICNDADAAAVADLCYTARPITAAPATAILAAPSAAPVLPAVTVPTPSSTSSTMAPSVTTGSTTNDLSCVVDLMVADADTSGTLNRNEFGTFLQLHALSATAASIVASASPRDNTTSTTSPATVTSTTTATSLQCMVPTDETVVTAAYATLVCASCLLSPSGSSNQAAAAATTIDLTCCTTSTTSTISTLGVQSPPNLRTSSEKDWITRLCVTATALLNCTSSSSSSSNATSMTPAINGTNASALPLLPGNNNATNTSLLVAPAAVNNTTSANDTIVLSLNTTNGTIMTNSSSNNTTSAAPVPSPAIINPNSTNGNTNITLAPAAASTLGTATPVPAVADAAAAAATTTAEAPRSSGAASIWACLTCWYGLSSAALVSILTTLLA